MSNKQSSIEHYEEEINKLINQFFKKSISKTDFIIQNHNLFYTIQEMHKEEIVKSNEAGFDDGIGFIEEIKYKNAEDYYIKTYGGNDEL